MELQSLPHLVVKNGPDILKKRLNKYVDAKIIVYYSMQSLDVQNY